MLTHNIWRTTTFRLAIIFAATFAAGIVLLLGLIYVQTAGYMSQRADQILTAEFEPLRHSRPEEILTLLKETSARDPLTGFGLFSPTGERLAGLGNLAPRDLPLDGVPRDFPERSGLSPQRGLGERLPWGDVLIVQRDTRQLMELRDVIFDALMWSGGSIVGLGLLLGLGLSLQPLRRVRSMQQASDAIAQGDLKTRLPVDGSHDELDQLARIVNAMMDELERLVTQAQTVGESVAHELRTPMTRLRTTLDHLAHGVDPEDPRGRMIESCIGEADGLLSRFRGLLRIAAVEARHRQSGIAVISLSNLVDQVAELYAPLALDRELEFLVFCEPALEARADPGLMVEAISNLVDNALKFTPAGGVVRLTLSRTALGPMIEVRDNGIGVPESERLLVLQRFYRSHDVASLPGHGLGLSLVAAVASLHGFDLSITDAGPGAVFGLLCRSDPHRAASIPVRGLG